MNSKQYSVLVLGAGQIAAGYDAPDSDSVLTHAHAINRHPGFNLLGFYDTDADKAKQAAEKWGGRAYETAQSADVIIICTPDDVHLDSIRQATALSPKMIILEKPIAGNLEDTERILATIGDIPVQVNFSRRFVPAFQQLAVSIKDYGSFLTGTGHYGKGLIHNGSHMFDLLRLLIGEMKSAEMISMINDYSDDDLTKTARLRFDSGDFIMCAVDCRHYTVFELDLCFEKARVQILDGGRLLKVYKPTESQVYSGYLTLTLDDEIYPETDNAMMNLYQNVYEHLTDAKALISPIAGAVVKGLYSI